MRIQHSDRGFEFLMHDVYPPEPGAEKRLASQSSVVGDYDNSLSNPGSSALWIGDDFHLNREEVAELRDRLSAWLETGSLRFDGDPERR